MAIAAWNGTGIADWSAAADWSTGAVPDGTTDVQLNGTGTYTTTITAAATANSVTLNNATATLLDSASLSLTGALSITAGTFNLDTAGSLNWAGAPGIINIDTGATFHTTGTHTLDNLRINMGTPTAAFTFANLTFDTLTLGTTALVSLTGGDAISGNSSYQQITGTSLTNNGTIEALQNYASGLIFVTTLVNNGSLINASLSGYTVEATNLTNTGLISASNGGGIGISAFTSFINSGTLVDNGGMAISTANFVNNGAINIGGANSYLALTAGTPTTGTGTINLGGTADILEFMSSQTFDQGTVNVTGAGSIIGVVASAVSATGALLPTTVTLGTGAVINQTAGTLSFTSATIFGGGTPPAENLVNNGQINLSASGGTATIATLGFTNNGTIAVSNGDAVKLVAATDGTGTIALAGGSTLEVVTSMAATDTVTFADAAANMLRIDNAAAFAAAINGFAQGDTIDLGGVVATSAHWAGGVLAVQTAGGVFNFAMAGAFANTAFNVASDGTGGSLISIGTAAPTPGTLAGSFALATATEGQATSGAIATFTDSNAADAAAGFTALITWGDGTTSTGTVTGSNGVFSVTSAAGHVYADEGSFAASVLVTRTADNAALTLGGAASVTVGEADSFTITGAPAIAATSGQAFSGTIATFTDSYTGNTAADFTATINWGDGTTSQGTITDTNGVITVSGSHAWAAAGTDTVTVTLKDTDGTATAQTTAQATIVPPVTTGQTYTLTTRTDKIAAGSGNNTIIAAGGTLTKGDVIDGGIGGTNTLKLTGGGAFNLAAPTTLADIQIVSAQEGAGTAWQTITLRSGLNEVVNVASSSAAGAGITIIGANDASTINLGNGNDTVKLGSVSETVNGGTGNDTFGVTAATIGATIHGGSGHNLLAVSGAGTAVMGANITNVGQVNLAASGKDWNFTANATAGLVVNDLSTGQNDTIRAGGTGQTLMGGGQDQTFVGFGSGITTYADSAAKFNGSTIRNFSAGDVIDITGLAFARGTAVSFDPSGSGAGELSLSLNGAFQTQIHVFGGFAGGHFSAMSDGHGGTLITAH